ncbi:MAG: hypothetical protein V3U75_03150, partial [Methylococcaceae bacterium]
WYTGVGRAIVDSWGFPSHIVDAVDEHELIDRERVGHADITDVIVVANVLAKAGEEQDKSQLVENLGLDEMPSLSRMHFDGETVLNFIEESDEEVSSMMQALAG